MNTATITWTKLTDTLYVSECKRFSIVIEQHRRSDARFQSARNKYTRTTELRQTGAESIRVANVKAAKALAATKG